MNALAPSAMPPPLVTVRPMVLFSGFLGAGKTTLLRSCLKSLTDRHLSADVILNDRENAELDCETLRDQAASVSALAGSCVCCDGLDELTELAQAASKTHHDLLLIELNGTADPVPLLETFTLLESRFMMQPRWQVCVIDVRHFGKRKAFRDLEALQLETASHYFLSHTGELEEDDIGRLRERVRSINPKASETTAEDLTEQLARAVARNQRLAVGKSSVPQTSRGLAAPHLHDPRHQLAHEFTGCQIILPEPVQALRLMTWLSTLPDSVIRAKALASTTDKPDLRYLFERVGGELCPEPLEVPVSDRVPASAILIGAELDPAKLLESARTQLGKECVIG